MFIKLTRLNQSAIWINASFVVTVEPRKGGGSIVVPIGDGLDYDVKESPEAVLAMLANAPAPSVVPVPAPKGLAPTLASVDVSPDADAEPPEEPAPKQKPAPKPEKKPEITVSPAPETPDADAEAADASVEPASAAEPADEGDQLDVFRTAKPVLPAAPEKPAPRAHAKRTRPTASRKAAKATGSPELDDDQLARLRKLAPSSVRKLQNTLTSQFSVADPAAALASLQTRGVLSIDRDHVVWAQ